MYKGIKEQKIKCRCVGFVFAIGGCIIQAFRISNGQYGSWMTTIQYHLNLAGWYYSIFSVVICFLFGDAGDFEDDAKDDFEIDAMAAGLDVDELELMDPDDRAEALEDAGLDPDDYDFD